jgi:hypothetical protein
MFSSGVNILMINCKNCRVSGADRFISCEIKSRNLGWRFLGHCRCSLKQCRNVWCILNLNLPVFLQWLHKTVTCREGRYQWLHTYTIYVTDLLMMSGWRSKHVEALNFYIICKTVYRVGINKRIILRCTANQISISGALFLPVGTVLF